MGIFFFKVAKGNIITSFKGRVQKKSQRGLSWLPLKFKN